MLNVVVSDKIYTPSEYGKEIGVKGISDNISFEELRALMDSDDNLSTFWDFPLSEIDELLENGEPVVLVRFSDGEVRWFELPTEDDDIACYELSRDEYEVIKMAAELSGAKWLRITPVNERDNFYQFYDRDINNEMSIGDVLFDLNDNWFRREEEFFGHLTETQIAAWKNLIRKYKRGV